MRSTNSATVAGVRDATGGDHRDVEHPGRCGDQHESRNVVLAGVTGALEPRCVAGLPPAISTMCNSSYGGGVIDGRIVRFTPNGLSVIAGAGDFVREIAG